MRPVYREEALEYDKESLKEHILKRKENIKIFETAILNEKEEIQRELKMIAIIEEEENKKK